VTSIAREKSTVGQIIGVVPQVEIKEYWEGIALGDFKNSKEKIINIIKELSESLDSDKARKINFEQLERISRRLALYYDECKECQEYTNWIIEYAEEKNNFRDFIDKQDLLSYHRYLKAIVSHMQNKHKLIVDGQYMGMYMSIGLAIGAGLGSAFKNIAIGVSIGLCIGLAVGAGVDADYKKKGLVL
jgi:hypothetical protein